MKNEKKKELLNAYKNRTVIGGVYCILCNGNQHRWLRSTTDLIGIKNRFEQSVRLKGAFEPSMLTELSEYGADSFSFIVLEELKKNEMQSDKEFADDIKTLFEIWNEKYESGEFD